MFAVWPENWLALMVFRRMGTQWVVGGMGGVVGLRYEALPMVMKVAGVPRSEWQEVFDGVQTMERRALSLLNK